MKEIVLSCIEDVDEMEAKRASAQEYEQGRQR
jgi:hypothetical protein